MTMAKRYLDPKADLTFKKVFGEHPDLVISLLNALLPLKRGEEIESVEYLTPELVPENPLRKFSIVDVRCKDNRGRQFVVEMQMVWSREFEQRVMFNSAKAYVRQLDSKEQYHLIEPVYSLNIVNDIFHKDISRGAELLDIGLYYMDNYANKFRSFILLLSYHASVKIAHYILSSSLYTFHTSYLLPAYVTSACLHLGSIVSKNCFRLYPKISFTYNFSLG